MKKNLLICAMLFAALFANAAEYHFDTQDTCEMQGGGKTEFKDGCHVLRGVQHFWTKKMFPYDSSKKYTISADIMTDCKEKQPVIISIVFFDEKGSVIHTREYLTAPNGFTELAEPIKPNDKTITIKKTAGFRKHPQWNYVLAFEAKSDKSDLPNSKVTTVIKKMDIGADTITLSIDKPTFASYPAGTKVRLHYYLSFFLPINLQTYYNHPTAQWQTFRKTIDIPRQTKYFKPAIIIYDRKKDTEKYVLVRNFKLIEE